MENIYQIELVWRWCIIFGQWSYWISKTIFNFMFVLKTINMNKIITAPYFTETANYIFRYFADTEAIYFIMKISFKVFISFICLVFTCFYYIFNNGIGLLFYFLISSAKIAISTINIGFTNLFSFFHDFIIIHRNLKRTVGKKRGNYSIAILHYKYSFQTKNAFFNFYLSNQSTFFKRKRHNIRKMVSRSSFDRSVCDKNRKRITIGKHFAF